MCILWRKPALKLDEFKQKAADNLFKPLRASKGANLDRTHLWAGARNIGAKAVSA